MSFIRLNITAEGQTEEQFVKNVLSTHLGNFNISTDVRRVLTSKDKRKSYRGGLLSYVKAKNDIVTWLREDSNPEARFSTMFDLYALPNDFPSYEESMKINDIYSRVEFLEQAMKDDIGDYRFIPYIQIHEFEALVFANLHSLKDEYIGCEAAIAELENQLSQCEGNPELVNNKRETAPSKRLEKEIPEYDKVSAGAFIAGSKGVAHLKHNCRHFGSWVDSLEKLT